MSTPRPSEADVEALTEVVREAFMGPARDRIAYALAEGRAQKAVQAFLASDWLAARDAEHEREVAALETLAADQTTKYIHATARAEAAERALADLRGEIKALADEWETEAGEDSEAWRVYGPQSVSVPFAVASLRALLPRDDAADDGSPS